MSADKGVRAEDGEEAGEERDRPQHHERARRVVAVPEHHHRQRRGDHHRVASLFETGCHEPSARLAEMFGRGRASHQHPDADRGSGDEEHGEKRHGVRIVLARLRVDGPPEGVATVGRCLMPQLP